jgi:hypothetical protein
MIPRKSVPVTWERLLPLDAEQVHRWRRGARPGRLRACWNRAGAEEVHPAQRYADVLSHGRKSGGGVRRMQQGDFRRKHGESWQMEDGDIQEGLPV